MIGVLPLMLLGLVVGVAPLSDEARRQLATASDGSRRFDEGALYPLLRDVLEWEAQTHAAGARLPDYDALRSEPARHRGERLVIEGTYQGSGPFRLMRAGPWGRELTWWVIKHGPTPDEVAVVYFPDAAEALPEVRRGSEVRVIARFYKIWRDIDDPTGEVTDFLTFVGRHPRVAAETGGGAPMLSVPQMALLLVLLIAAAIFIALRQRVLSLRPRPLPRQQATLEADVAPEPSAQSEADAQGHDEADAPLPSDPAAALDELSRRRAGGDANQRANE